MPAVLLHAVYSLKRDPKKKFIWHPDGIKAFTDDPNFKKEAFGFVKGTVTVEGYLILSECQIKKRETRRFWHQNAQLI